MSEPDNLPEVTLDAPTLLGEAIEVTGLSDFGNDSFREPFEVLVQGLNEEANLNAVGRYLQYQRLLNTLKNRLRLEEYLRRFPEILAEEVLAPVVIVGLPRTGTTMLHRIMASDSRFFAPLWYEVRNPAPYLDWNIDKKDQRLTEAEAEVRAILEANPEIAAIHPMDPLGADEEILLLEHSFYSTVPNAFCHLPTYGEWLTNNDNTPGYNYLKTQLKFLQWQKKRRGQQAERWLLKTPHHLHHMGTLLKTFPDASIIQTHRDPVVTIPSICSFNYNLWITQTDHADKHQLASQWSGLFARGMRHTMAVREKLNDRFVDINFKDSVANPLETASRVYEFIHMPLTREAKAAMEKYREENKREDRPIHDYSLEEYGLTEKSIEEQFKDYRREFITS